MKGKPVTVIRVIEGSVAEEAGVEPGDIILSINGEEIRDIFDYRFITTNEELQIELQKKDGELWELEIEKDEYEDLGIEFGSSMIDEASGCTNKCIFCFIDQLPRGMRDTLYFKDDDSRLSFLTGNYVTLTNISHDELDRIIRYRMSPINVSVHTTNPDLRVFMLRNRFAADIIDKIRRLTDGGIKVNCQIVACKYVNDGAELDRTIEELSSLHPGIVSISVVPVGITRYREGLSRLLPYDTDSSGEIVDRIESFQRDFLCKFGSRLVYLADEFYIMSGRNIPEVAEYEDFPQLENGVGLMALLIHEFESCLADMGDRSDLLLEYRKVSIATGRLAYEFIKDMAGKLEKRYNNLKVCVYEINNLFFGENVTVSGLITGSDLVDQLSGRELGSDLLISVSMLKAGEDILLDDYTLPMLEERLNVRITPVDNRGRDFIHKVLGLG